MRKCKDAENKGGCCGLCSDNRFCYTCFCFNTFENNKIKLLIKKSKNPLKTRKK